MSDDIDVDFPAPDASDTGEHYFRTFAKDAAALGGSTKSTVPTPPPKAPSVPAKTPEPAPIQEEVLPPQPPTVPSEPNLPPAHIIPKAPSTDESRESVLARLRRKAGQSGPIPTPDTRSQPLSNDRSEVLARLKANASKNKGAEMPAGVRSSVPEVGRMPEATPSPIHTYKTDFADHTKVTGASRISVLARQQDAGTPAPRTLSTKKNTRYVFLGGAALIVLGIGSVWLAYSLVSKTPVLPSGFTVPSLITPNDRAELTGTGQTLRSALVELQEQATGEGDVVVAYMTYSTTTADGVTTTLPVTGGDVIKALSLPAPDIILRNISSESTVGVVRGGGESRPFFILRVDSYERTFAGMLTWEATMLKDLAFMYPTPTLVQPTTSTSTSATSTQAVASPSIFAPRFVDEVVENHDTRIVYGADGGVILLYGYRDKETLVIAGSKEAFAELITRLSSSRAR